MEKYAGYIEVELSINTQKHSVLIKPQMTLLHTIRDQLGLTGPKCGCENGDCGACTVLIDMKPVKSCMTLTLDVLDKEIVTIEGLKNTEIQNAFIEHGGFQCGFCTSGFILNAYAMLKTNVHIDEAGQKNWLDSNLCRCTGYEGIKNAVLTAQENMIKKDSTP